MQTLSLGELGGFTEKSSYDDVIRGKFRFYGVQKKPVYNGSCKTKDQIQYYRSFERTDRTGLRHFLLGR